MSSLAYPRPLLPSEKDVIEYLLSRAEPDLEQFREQLRCRSSATRDGSMRNPRRSPRVSSVLSLDRARPLSAR
jgi:hypothetical protein